MTNDCTLREWRWKAFEACTGNVSPASRNLATRTRAGIHENDRHGHQDNVPAGRMTLRHAALSYAARNSGSEGAQRKSRRSTTTSTSGRTSGQCVHVGGRSTSEAREGHAGDQQKGVRHLELAGPVVVPSTLWKSV